jgi:2,3,4,5-tetrahydropyridine-2-carboxylate N-succinyltransferase
MRSGPPPTRRCWKRSRKGACAPRQRDAAGTWHAVPWVKRAILIGFRRTEVVEIGAEPFSFFDKAAYPPRDLTLGNRVRLVPGGSSIRRGAFVAPGVVVMPPAYVNVGASVGPGTMVDSHALVGSCAQIGANVHLSAGAQIGGVLEPAHATPVVVEDGAFVGGLVRRVRRASSCANGPCSPPASC